MSYKLSGIGNLLHRNLKVFTHPKTASKVRLLNWLVLLSLTCLVATGFVNLYVNNMEMLMLNLLVTGLLLLYFPISIMTANKAVSAFWVFGILFSLVFYADLHYARQTDLILTFVPLGLSLTLLFDLKEWRAVVGTLLVPLFLLSIREMTWFNVNTAYTLDPLAVAAVQNVTMPLVLLAFGAFILLFLRELERNQRRLEVAEQRFSSVVQNSSDLIWAINARYELTAFNHTFEDTYRRYNGSQPQLGQYALEKTEARNESLWLDAFKQAFAGNITTVEVESNNRTFEYILTPEHGKNGVEGLNVIGRDISARKAVEDQLREKQRQLEEVASTLPGVVYQVEFTEKGSHFTYVGENTLEIFGITASQILNDQKQLEDLIHPEDLKAMQAVEEIANAQGTPFYMEVRMILPSGMRWFSLQSQPSPYREGIRTGLMVDITQRMDAETEVRKTKNLLEAVNHNLEEAIFRIDHKGTLVYSNPGFARLLGLDHAEGLKFETLFNNAGALKRIMTSLEKDAEISNVEVEFLKPNGEVFVGLLSCRRTMGKGAHHTDGSVRDISLLKKAHEEIERARHEAEESVREKTAFLNIVSHEIRNPLNAISGLANLLKKENLSTGAQEYVHALELSNRSLISVVSDIMDYSRMEAGKVALEPHWMNIHHFAHALERMARGLLDGKNIKLTIQVEEGTPEEFFADQHRLQQIFFNLVSNAIKFTHQGEVSAVLKKSDTGLWAEVKDTGIGIDKTQREEIFLSFNQGKPGIARQFGGTGLGLAIVKHLVELHHGSIKVKGKEGEGSTFTVSLPLNSRSASPVKQGIGLPHDQPETALEGKSILVVEDNQLNVLVAKQLLKKAGALVQVAENGRVCLEILKHSSPDLILMDLQMPELDGMETAQRIREEERQHNKVRTPIIALTANVMDETRHEVLEAGMDDYITKPFVQSELFEKMGKLLS